MAKYIRGAACDQPMLLPPSVDDYVSEGSPLRALDAFVDSLFSLHSNAGIARRKARLLVVSKR